MTIRVGSRSFSMPDLGAENPLPMVGVPLENPYRISSGDIPQEIIDGSQFGNPANLYPYTEQSAYERNCSDRELTTVVLENDRVRAVFLPELGGRLWELFDKKHGKQLLHSPDTIQFANLALRNAWFAGGIEWNIGTRGHSPTTCAPLHSALVQRPDGSEALRMWEFDRLREVVFQIDAWLPDDSDVLLVAVRLRNPNDFSVPMYWWTNAAVPQTADSRVVVPAGWAFGSNYDGGISRVSPTDDGGVDCTWPAASLRARDFFFDIPPRSRRWIVNADRDGDGLAMVSTPRLRGRKLFVWGQGTGGDSWQRWLTPNGAQYAEIQAGLAQTQFQHLELPAGAEWSWVEAYGNSRMNVEIAHGNDWDAVVGHASERVAALIPEDVLESAQAFADLAPQRSVLAGTGWGALEAVRRRRHGLPWIDETGTPFAPTSMTAGQRPWLDLLEHRGFAGAITFVRGADWAALLAAEPDGVHTLMHRAVMAHAGGDLDGARALYSQSIGHVPNAIAYRGLALLGVDERDNFPLACELEPGNAFLLVEAATTAISVGDAEGALRLIENARATERSGRIRLLEAQASAAAGQTDRAATILREGLEVADLREGENAMAALWSEIVPDEPIPARYQFSMNDEG
ncbi:DUF5107 domain-containing protein [Glaciihabitans sp. UYNi722]|uniref:DUF5107 domain-containing protein n=1 Tax=Glaciihabitans sp. UYNi722 TaxID=3156344 RepID=UPI003395F301